MRAQHIGDRDGPARLFWSCSLPDAVVSCVEVLDNPRRGGWATPRDVLSDVSSSWVAWLESMADHVPAGEFGWLGEIPAASVGVPIPLFNQAFVLQQPSVEELRRATRWMTERNVPFWITVPGSLADSVAEIADAAGLELSGDSTPGMALTSLTGVSRKTPADVDIVPAEFCRPAPWAGRSTSRWASRPSPSTTTSSLWLIFSDVGPRRGLGGSAGVAQ